jgi:hypothetical protein
MKEYTKPECEITVLVLESHCLSFNSTNNTENWHVESEETI